MKLDELTNNHKAVIAEVITTILVYGPTTVYYNKFGDKIQDWDEEGKKRAVRTGIGEGIVFTAYGSDELSAMIAVEEYKKENPVSRIEKL